MNGKIILLTIILIIFGLGISEVSAMSNAETTANNILNTDNGDSDTLIVYFSRTGENYNVGNVEVGNTAMLASYIKEYLKCDSFEIVPMDKYPENYDECTELASKEKEDNARPKIDGKIDNFDSYKTVFIGYPIWWVDLPMIMYTFLEEYDLDGKTVIPFNTMRDQEMPEPMIQSRKSCRQPMSTPKDWHWTARPQEAKTENSRQSTG
ncbi:MAG: flavodoxin [Methanobrevibacter sp.]|nr:flavodoxin [Methanobrevibacter sp.]